MLTEIYVTYYKSGIGGQSKYLANLTLLKDDKRMGGASGGFPNVAAVKKWARDWQKVRKFKYLTVKSLR